VKPHESLAASLSEGATGGTTQKKDSTGSCVRCNAGFQGGSLSIRFVCKPVLEISPQKPVLEISPQKLIDEANQTKSTAGPVNEANERSRSNEA
jgi:hypothetical protein